MYNIGETDIIRLHLHYLVKHYSGKLIFGKTETDFFDLGASFHSGWRVSD